jgi:hypothetical protein
MLLTHLNQSNSILLRQTDEMFLKRIRLNGVISGQTHEFKSKKSHEFASPVRYRSGHELTPI